MALGVICQGVGWGGGDGGWWGLAGLRLARLLAVGTPARAGLHAPTPVTYLATPRLAWFSPAGRRLCLLLDKMPPHVNSRSHCPHTAHPAPLVYCRPTEEEQLLKGSGLRVTKSRFGTSKCSACGGGIDPGVRIAKAAGAAGRGGWAHVCCALAALKPGGTAGRSGKQARAGVFHPTHFFFVVDRNAH